MSKLRIRLSDHNYVNGNLRNSYRCSYSSHRLQFSFLTVECLHVNWLNEYTRSCCIQHEKFFASQFEEMQRCRILKTFIAEQRIRLHHKICGGGDRKQKYHNVPTIYRCEFAKSGFMEWIWWCKKLELGLALKLLSRENNIFLESDDNRHQ